MKINKIVKAALVVLFIVGVLATGAIGGVLLYERNNTKPEEISTYIDSNASKPLIVNSTLNTEPQQVQESATTSAQKSNSTVSSESKKETEAFLREVEESTRCRAINNSAAGIYNQSIDSNLDARKIEVDKLFEFYIDYKITEFEFNRDGAQAYADYNHENYDAFNRYSSTIIDQLCSPEFKEPFKKSVWSN
jgi:hypothetical protein